MFTIFGCGRHVTRTRSRIKMSLYLKFELIGPVVSEETMCENINGRTDAGFMCIL